MYTAARGPRRDQASGNRETIRTLPSDASISRDSREPSRIAGSEASS